MLLTLYVDGSNQWCKVTHLFNIFNKYKGLVLQSKWLLFCGILKIPLSVDLRNLDIFSSSCIYEKGKV